jgi:hypothetical protein
LEVDVWKMRRFHGKIVTSPACSLFLRNWNPLLPNEILLRSGLKLKGNIMQIVPAMNTSQCMEEIWWACCIFKALSITRAYILFLIISDWWKPNTTNEYARTY